MKDIKRSSRHPKITGDFAEGLVLYLLSKNGFEAARIDHTGIDIVAKDPKTKEFMGISVKGRSRKEGNENASVSLASKKDFKKIKAACKAFGNCKPYFAIVVDGLNSIRVFIVRQSIIRRYSKRTLVTTWNVGNKYLDKYKKDDIKYFEFKYSFIDWWK